MYAKLIWEQVFDRTLNTNFKKSLDLEDRFGKLKTN
jgi:hypothetical protein